MSWLDAVAPARMRRVAIVAPAAALRDVLVRVAERGTAQLGFADGAPAGPDSSLRGPAAEPGDAARRLQRAGAPVPRPALCATRPDLDALERAGRYNWLAGEAQLEAYAGMATRRSGAAALAGWVPASELDSLSAALAQVGGAVVPLPAPPGVEPPSLIMGRPMRRSLSPLVQTYGTVPYQDLDPAWLAWGSYVLMFGMMFGDAGEGLVLLFAAFALRAGWPHWARRWQRAWPFVTGAGAAAALFGLLYGECFGPTGLVPVIWLNPLDHPIGLLLAAAGAGAVMLAGAYALGVVNRVREGGWPAALYAPSGIAGCLLFGGAGLLAAGYYVHMAALTVGGGVLAGAGLILAFGGFLAESGGGGAGCMQASVELFDLVVRLGANVVSFTRLAAFGLTHAALSMLVWEGTRALWLRGGVAAAAAVAVFAVGTMLAFGLEALIAAIQALRLEYYELFSRVFVSQGRPFRPWHLPVASDTWDASEASPAPGSCAVEEGIS
jgi:V/A-type H+/Na+-transporting ATPase subunit I